MLKILYFLLLMVASAEDYRYHTVKFRWTISVFLLGILNMAARKESRWVTLTLTCACFLLLFFLYQVVLLVAKHKKIAWQFGGADVRLIPGMMLVQGWDIALFGIFIGLVSALLYHWFAAGKKREIPLVPWMTVGCFTVEVIRFALNNILSW